MGHGGRLAAWTVAAILVAGCGSSARAGHPAGTRDQLDVAGSSGRQGSAAHGSVQPRGVRSTFPFGPFSGYLWLGPVDSVRATFPAPRVLAGSEIGRAATWVGAQGDGSPGPFIQVGVNETENLFGSGDYAFWSDVVLDFTPKKLFDVNAGDVMHTSLRHADGVWHVAIVDQTSGRAARFTTRQEGHARFDTAQWYQEDVTNSLANAPFPYPDLAPIRFSDVAVDGVDPPRYGLDFHWMRPADGPLIAPGPLRGQSFVVAPLITAPSAAGLRFLQIAHAEDGPANAFNLASDKWTSRTPAVEIATTSLLFEAALSQNIATLSHYGWPMAVRVKVDRLVAAVRRLDAVVRRASTLTIAQRGAWLRRVSDDSDDVNADAYSVRAALKMPAIGQAYTGPS